MTRGEIQKHLGLKARTNFEERYLKPALTAGLIEMTVPAKPKSRLQEYRFTKKGWRARHSPPGARRPVQP